MQTDKIPMFRKNSVPWYRSRLFCITIAAMAFCLALMGLLGIQVAGSNPDFQSFVWVPALLTAAAGLLCLVMLFRAWKGPGGRRFFFSRHNGGLK